MGIDEATTKSDLDRIPKLKKRHHNDQDPLVDFEKEKKKKRRRDTDASKSQKDKTPTKSSKEDKAPSKPSKTGKTVNVEESVQDYEMDAEDDVVDAQEPTQDDDAPEVDKSKWFKVVQGTKYRLGESLRGRCPYDLSKPLPLQGPPGHKNIPVNFFFNKDLEYLKTGNKENKYAVSLTKSKAARYELEGLEEMIPKLWSSSKLQYDLTLHLESITGDQSVNSSTEHDISKHHLHLNDIEDMFFLYVQNKLHHLTGEDQFDLVNSLLLFIRRVVIKKRVEDIQLGVESVVYKTKSNRTILMRDDELYKFSDGTLKSVHDNLDLMLHNFESGYNNQGIPNQAWSVKDHKRTSSMLKKIDKTLLERRIMWSLESFVGGRRVETDYRLLIWTE
ncbi:hypothetical protein Tco_1024509 [Tanacetum coccineum]